MWGSTNFNNADRRKIMNRRLIVCLLLLTGGLILWIQHRRMIDVTSAIAQLRTQIEDAKAEQDRLRALVQEATERSASTEKELAESHGDSTQTDRLQYWTNDQPCVRLSKKMLHEYDLINPIHLNTLTKRFQVHDCVAILLALTPSERKELDQVIAGIGQELQNEQLKYLSEVGESEPLEDPQYGVGHKTSFRIAPFPDNALMLRQRFVDLIQPILGQQRGELLVEWLRKADIRCPLVDFGTSERILTITSYVKNNVIHQIRREQCGSSVWVSRATTKMGRRPQEAPPEWRHLVNFPDSLQNTERGR